MMFDAEAIARIKGSDEVYLVCKNDERLEDGHKDKTIHRCMWLKDFVSEPVSLVPKKNVGGRPKGSKNKSAAKKKPAAKTPADLGALLNPEPVENPAEEDNDRQALRRNEEEGDGSAPDRERGWNGESGQQ